MITIGGFWPNRYGTQYKEPMFLAKRRNECGFFDRFFSGSMRIRRYSELRRFQTFEERFDYLKLGGEVGAATFGFDRWMNQQFYRSYEWRYARDQVIARDGACDLGHPDHEIRARLLVHHMNPITPEDLEKGEPWVLEPEFLITTSHRTHNAIHYGDDSLLVKPAVERRPGDTKLW